MSDALAPWNATLSLAEHTLIVFALSVAGLALFAFFVKSWVSVSEVTGRYRSGVYAGLCITGIAFLSYVLLVLEFAIGYDRKGESWVPNANAILSWAPRYFDWTVTVPLLVIELIAVATLAGAAARRLRAVGIAAAFLMISTGFVGGVVIDSGTNTGALWTWGVISGVFMVILYVLVIYVVVKGGRDLKGTEAAGTLRNAGILLIVTWTADIVAKVGFGSMIHKIAKLRSAEDVRTGVDTLPEALWISSEKLSDGTLPNTATAHHSQHATAPGAQRARR
jgi:bacteriorhodopsin